LNSSNTNASFLLRHIYSVSKCCPNICNLPAFVCQIEILEIIRCSMLTLKLANILLLYGLRRLIPSVGIVVYSTESLFCYIICCIQYTNFTYYNFVYSYFHYAYLFFFAFYLCLVFPCVFRLFSFCQCNWLLVVMSAS